MPLIIPTNSISAVGYEVDNSLRLNGADNPKLSRTAPNTAPTNADKFTFSCWIKRSSVDEGSGFERQQIFDSNDETVGPNVQFQMYLNQNNLKIQTYNGSNQMELITNRKFRDVSSWYSIIFIYDSSQGTASDRAKLYINGVQETSFSTETYPPQNTDGEFGIQNKIQMIGNNDANTRDFDGYMAEVIGVDGQALAHTDFGEFDEDTGIWKPINVSGIDVGNLGFYLDFQNSGALGTDVSGVGNFTLANLSSIDQSTDTPTNNFCTLSPLWNSFNQGTLSEGNTVSTMPSAVYQTNLASFGVSQGKWYWEIKLTQASNMNFQLYGVTDESTDKSVDFKALTGSTVFNNTTGKMQIDGSELGSASSVFAQGDIVGIALNMDDKQISIYKNGVSLHSNVAMSTTSNLVFPCHISYNYSTYIFEYNFGNPAFTISSGNSDGNGYGNFEYSVPSGYYALNTKNLAEYG